MKDRLRELLGEHGILCGVICRDATFTDIEVLAASGCHVIWMDFEHSPVSMTRAAELCRLICHTGMVPMARIIELARTHVQGLLDWGYQVILLPDVRDERQASELIRLGTYPPRGDRGVSTSAAGLDFNLGSDVAGKLAEANAVTHLAVQFESDAGFERLDAICAMEDIDVVTVGPGDWAISSGLFGKEKAALTPKVEQVIKTAADAGKTVAMGVGSAEQATRYVQLGARVLFAGVDVNLKRRVFQESLAPFQALARDAR